MAKTVNNWPAMQETCIWFLGQEDPWEENGNPVQYSRMENSMDREILADHSPWVAESNMSERQHFLTFILIKCCSHYRIRSNRADSMPKIRVQTLGFLSHHYIASWKLLPKQNGVWESIFELSQLLNAGEPMYSSSLSILNFKPVMSKLLSLLPVTNPDPLLL